MPWYSILAAGEDCQSNGTDNCCFGDMLVCGIQISNVFLTGSGRHIAGDCFDLRRCKCHGTEHL